MDVPQVTTNGSQSPRPEAGAPRTALWRGALWGRGFRPFFLLVGLYGCGSVIVWIAALAGWLAMPGWFGPIGWHGHEMIFGVVAGAVAGFLLTSVPVWTGSPAVYGGRLAALAGLWVAGRGVMIAAAALPPLTVAAVDLAFLPALAGTLAAPLLRAGQVRNWGFVPILLVLFGANVAMHGQASGMLTWGASGALRLAVDLLVLLIVIIGGRITPSFTANAFRRRGITAAVRSWMWLDRAAVLAVALVALVDLLLPRTVWSGGVALAAATAVAGRMSGWQSLRTGHDPLLWSLHAGYAWVAVGLMLVGISDLTGAVPMSAGLHALTAGAMGAMILSVMTRVSLGHTGRPLVLPGGAVLIYGLVHAGALVRTLGPMLAPTHALPVLGLAGVLWASAFGLFVTLYWRVLTSPRVDGAAG